MTDQEKSESPLISIFLIAVPLVFYFFGTWAGIIGIIIGLPILGWKNRHDGPFPTNKPED